MKSLFVVALFNFKLHGHFGRGLRLSDIQFLTNDADHIRSLLSERFERVAGLIETSAIRNARGVVYAITEHQSKALPEDEAGRYLNRQLGLIQSFLMSLWLVKDNSVNIELGFLEYPYRNPFDSSVTSNFRTVRFCEASGVVRDCEFTGEEVRLARDFYKLFEANAVHRDDENVGYIVPTDFTRFDRVLYFAQVARSVSNLGLKIANYVTCFECLFCTDSAELTHKLSERVALFLGTTPEERLELFKAAKTAYTIRSKTVHGDTLTKKQANDAASLAMKCDNMLREIIKKVLTTPELLEIFIGSAQKLEDYLNGLVFGVSNAHIHESSTT